MKIEVNAAYRTRRGEIVKIMRIDKSSSALYPVKGVFVEDLYRSNEQCEWMIDGIYDEGVSEGNCDLVEQISLPLILEKGHSYKAACGVITKIFITSDKHYKGAHTGWLSGSPNVECWDDDGDHLGHFRIGTKEYVRKSDKSKMLYMEVRVKKVVVKPLTFEIKPGGIYLTKNGKEILITHIAELQKTWFYGYIIGERGLYNWGIDGIGYLRTNKGTYSEVGGLFLVAYINDN